MTNTTITALEQAVMTNIIKLSPSLMSVPQTMIVNGPAALKGNQVSAVINNLIGKGLAVREQDFFGFNATLTKAGKAHAKKMVAMKKAA
jgi:hypothetical protein